MDNNRQNTADSKKNVNWRGVKKIKVKNLLLLAFIIIVAAAIFFGYLYYRGITPDSSFTVGNELTPPEFLMSIYEGKNKLSHPIAVAVDKERKIYVSNNSMHTIEVISSGGKPLREFGGSGENPGKLLFPYGIGLLPNGNILVAETGNYRIQEFTLDGKYVKTFSSKFNKVGLQKPGPIYVDSQDHIYIGDISGHQVFVFDQSGKVLRNIKNISYPHGIAVDESGKKLYVSDSGEVAVKVFSLEDNDDKPIQIIGHADSGKLFSMVRGLAVDKLGRLYVVDTISSVIRVFDNKGGYLFSFGTQGFGDGEFIYPNGIFVDDDNKIYVTDWSNNRVQIWGY